MSFGRDTKSRWSLLSGVYARGSKRSHTGGKCVTCSGLSNSREGQLWKRSQARQYSSHKYVANIEWWANHEKKRRSDPQDCSKHFTLYFPDRPVQSNTVSTSLGSHMPQLICEGCLYTYPPLSIARYSFIQLSELEQCRVKKLAQSFNTAARDSNPGPLSGESKALPLNHWALNCECSEFRVERGCHWITQMWCVLFLNKPLLTVRMRLSVHSRASSLASRVTSSDDSAIAFAVAIKSRFVPPSPL